ncbi:hypothetical protein [Paenibacillus hamazuiensis]|uniref:hypothetical protein n=1 Tax=Paenibacillus hamazuiensis TaxID=2936508 RepID=UPI00200E56EF|nr:hypothetical protein [Paenibacillus hamazuiensis]
MLIAVFIVIITLAALVLYSLRFTRKVLHPVEIIVNWLMISAISDHLFILNTLTHKMIFYEKKLIIFFILTLNAVLLTPGLTVWLLNAWFHPQLNVYQKGIFVLWWFLLTAGADYALHTLGLTTFIRWNQAFQFLHEIIMLLLSLAFAHLYRYLLRKEGEKP